MGEATRHFCHDLFRHETGVFEDDILSAPCLVGMSHDMNGQQTLPARAAKHTHIWIGETHAPAGVMEASHLFRRAQVPLRMIVERPIVSATQSAEKKQNKKQRTTGRKR